MNSRKLLVVVGAALLVAAWLMPVPWYSSLPFRQDLPAPRISGVTLLRAVLALQAVAVLAAAALGWRFTRRSDAAADVAAPAEDALDARTAARLLTAITVLALALRLYHISSDLWLDEISALVGFGSAPITEIIGVFSRSGNHLLNTLLVKWFVAMFGETEWAARLPAALFGVATVPALYWVARLALTRSASLAAALLLAVSYHHVFFSQNARGYSAYMFFSVVSTGFFVRALEDDRLRMWTWFVVTTLLNVVSLILSGFVIAGHGLTGLGAAFAARRAGGDAAPRVRRLVVAFAIIGLASLTVYALIIPQAYAGLTAPYKGLTSGFAPLSREFVMDVVRGIVQGFGPLVLIGAVPFLGIAAVGFVVLVRRHATLAFSLASPLVLTLVVFVARHMTLRPRFFLLAVPVAMVCFVQGLWTLSDLVTARSASARVASVRVKGASVTVLTIASLVALVGYYRVPKQSYRDTLAFLEQTRRPGDPVIVFGNAELGFRFYGARARLRDSADYVYVREPAGVDSLLASRRDRPVYLVFTLGRDIRLREPGFAERLERDWTRMRVFPATVGDGNITVMRYPSPGDSAAGSGRGVEPR